VPKQLFKSEGYLFSFGAGEHAAKVGEFSGKLVAGVRGLAGVARSVVYMSDDGSGAMSRGMAKDALIHVKKVWRNEDGYRAKVPGVTKLKSPKPYRDWKSKVFPGSKLSRVLTGTSVARFKVLKRAGSIYTLGIDARDAVRSPMPGTNPLKYSRTKRRITDYNKNLEFSLGYQVVSPALVDWAQRVAPEWASSLDALTQRIRNRESAGYTQRRTERVALAAVSKAQGEREAAEIFHQNLIQSSKGLDDQAIDAHAEAKELQQAASGGEDAGGGGRDFISPADAKLFKDTLVKKQGKTPREADVIVRTMFQISRGEDDY